MGRKSKRKSKANQCRKTSTSKKPVSIDDRECLVALKSIPITDRLSLPAYQSEDPDEEDSELQLDFKPRAYFFGSLCFRCSAPCDGRFVCEKCRMVAFCSAEHRRPHGQLCAVLGSVLHDNAALALARDLGAEEFRSFRVGLLRVVESALGRKLELREREILLYPRLCRTCHAAEELETCPHCAMELFCADERHRLAHAEHCSQFRLFARILELERESGFAAPRIPNFVLESERELPQDFDELVKEIYAFGCDYEKIDCASYAALSQTASPALTAFYVLTHLQRSNQNILVTNR